MGKLNIKKKPSQKQPQLEMIQSDDCSLSNKKEAPKKKEEGKKAAEKGVFEEPRNQRV